MKKLYTLSLVLFAGLTSFAQVIFSENFGTTAPSATPYPSPTDYTGYQNAAPIVFTGVGSDVRTTLPSASYSGASGGSNVFFNADAEFLRIDGINTSGFTTSNMVLSFGYNGSPTITLEQSVDGNTWTPITYTLPSGSNWRLVQVDANQIASSTSLSLRWTLSGSSSCRVDDVQLSNGGSTCTLALGATDANCDNNTAGVDTYTATVAFTGGGSTAVTISTNAGTVSGDDPSTAATGTITISGVNEGTALVVTVTGGDCNLSANIASPVCNPILELPINEPFDYAFEAPINTVGTWTTFNNGDVPTVADGSLAYTGIPSVGNSLTFAGEGAEIKLDFQPVNSGTIYASFLLNVSNYDAITGGENFFAAFGRSADTGSYEGRLFIRKADAQFNLGGAAGSNISTTGQWSDIVFDQNQPVLIVVSYNFETDVLNYWFNPTVAGFSENTTPTFSLPVATPYTSFNTFKFRQNQNSNTPTMTIDALRIGLAPGDVLSRNEQSAISGLKVYPNPVVNGILNIETTANAERNVQIFDIVGKQVVNLTTATNNINVSALRSGVYIAKITEEGKTATVKFVVK